VRLMPADRFFRVQSGVTTELSQVRPNSMIRTWIKAVTPTPLLRRANKFRVWKSRKFFAQMTRAETFSVVYRDRLWGVKPGVRFYSGDGSDDPFAELYSRRIANYIADNGISSIVDIGCGDFRVGWKLTSAASHYCGVDVVPELIDYNLRKFGSDRVSFKCLDVVDDALPAGDLCLMRQVLQHLSNAEIQSVLKKLRAYAHVIITEQVPSGVVRFPNKDKPHGPDTRLFDGSGVFLSLPPFSCGISATWELPCDTRTKFLTVLIEHLEAHGNVSNPIPPASG
jgi:SAM-dependent methyltransferase